jgi:hypothetical protein
MGFRFLLGAGAAALLAGLLYAAGPALPAAPFEMPLTFDTFQPIVKVGIDGAAAVPFVVDTGASIHVVDPAVVPRAAAAGPERRLAGGGEGNAAARDLGGLAFAVEGVVFPGQRATLVSLGYPKKHFAGLLGAPILKHYAVQFDFPARRLRFFDPAAYTAPPGAVQVPFELQEDLPVVRVKLDAGNGPVEPRLMVDTGAATFIDLNRPFVDAHHLVEALANAEEENRPAAIGSKAPFFYGNARRVEFAGQVFENPRLGLSRATSGSSSRGERDGVLGNFVVRDFRMTVDYRRRVIVIERAPTPG